MGRKVANNVSNSIEFGRSLGGGYHIYIYVHIYIYMYIHVHTHVDTLHASIQAHT